MDHRLVRALQARRDRETGPGRDLTKEAPLRVCLAYPSPYQVAMSSLGYLQLYRLANLRPRTRCDRAILPDPKELEAYRATQTPLLTVERQERAVDVHCFAISHAYELELTGVVELFKLAGMPPLARDREPGAWPLVVFGGPITFSNALPSSVFADLMVLGEAEAPWLKLLDYLEQAPEAARGDPDARSRLLAHFSREPGFFIPSLHRAPGPLAKAPGALLPAYSDLFSPDTELSNMMLIEPERGCHRLCGFCVMRRSTNDGMRWLSQERVLSLIPDGVEKVGLVGAAVTDHPDLEGLLSVLIEERGLRVGVSSLRADRLSDRFVGLLKAGGYRSLTVALDAASHRLRQSIDKRLGEKHIERAARLSVKHGMHHLKIYVIVNLPGETEADREELCDFVLRLRESIPIVLGVSPFIPKFNTPMADAPFAGIKAVEQALKQLNRRLRGKVELRGSGAREAYVEYRLAQGGPEHGEVAIQVAEAGGKLSAWVRALKGLPERHREPDWVVLAPRLPGRTRIEALR